MLLAGPPRPDAVWEWALVCGLALAGGLCAVRLIGPAFRAVQSSDPRLVVQFAALGAALAFVDVDATVTAGARELALVAVALIAGLVVGVLTRRWRTRHRPAQSE